MERRRVLNLVKIPVLVLHIACVPPTAAAQNPEMLLMRPPPHPLPDPRRASNKLRRNCSCRRGRFRLRDRLRWFPPRLPLIWCVWLHTDIRAGGGALPARPSTAIEVDSPTGSGAAPPESSADQAGGSAASSSPPHHPHATRLQQGISQPKSYADVIVRWCMLSSAATEEPAIVEDAL